MIEYAFEVRLRAVVRVRAENEELACKVVPSVLGSPGSVEIGLANQNNNAALGNMSIVTDVEFYQEGSPVWDVGLNLERLNVAEAECVPPYTKAACAPSLCETVTLHRGRKPGHARKAIIGT